MVGFHDQDYSRGQRIAALSKRIDCLTTDDLFQPITSCSTTDRLLVELLVSGDRIMGGYFNSDLGCWMCNGGKDRLPEGLYPTHWRKLRPSAVEEVESAQRQMARNAASGTASLTDSKTDGVSVQPQTEG